MSARGFKPTDDATLGVKRDSQQRQPDSEKRSDQRTHADAALMAGALSTVRTECDLHGLSPWNEFVLRLVRISMNRVITGCLLSQSMSRLSRLPQKFTVCFHLTNGELPSIDGSR